MSIHQHIRAEDFIAYHDLKLNRVAGFLKWSRERFEKVLQKREWISFEEREALAEAIGCAYPTMLDVKTRVQDGL